MLARPCSPTTTTMCIGRPKSHSSHAATDTAVTPSPRPDTHIPHPRSWYQSTTQLTLYGRCCSLPARPEALVIYQLIFTTPSPSCLFLFIGPRILVCLTYKRTSYLLTRAARGLIKTRLPGPRHVRKNATIDLILPVLVLTPSLAGPG